MKIKLNRALWNRKSGEEIEIGEDRGTWAVMKGYAEQVNEPETSCADQIESQPENKVIVTIKGKDLISVLEKAENKAIVPEYKQRGRKPKNDK